MIISDFSEQSFNHENLDRPIPLVEIISAGMIFILPIIFLLVISAS